MDSLGPLAMIWGLSETLAAGAVAIALLSFLFSLFQYLRARHEETIRALQGQKETVAYIAYRLSEGRGRFPWSAKRRKDVLMSLCLAALFEKSGRSRTLLYRALGRAATQHRDEVMGIIEDIEQHFEDYGEISRLEKGRKRLEQLKLALGSKGPGVAHRGTSTSQTPDDRIS